MFTSPKSKRSVRAIGMSPQLREASQIHREFHPALVRAGLRKIRFHDLRHTYTTLLIAQDANAKFIQAQLGHASIQTTFDRYGHLLPVKGDEVGLRLDATVFGSSREALKS